MTQQVNTVRGGQSETVDIDRITKIIPHSEEGEAVTYTIIFDGAHDDTNASGKTLAGDSHAVGEHSDKKDVRGNWGNRYLYTATEAAPILEAYNYKHGTTFGETKPDGDKANKADA